MSQQIVDIAMDKETRLKEILRSYGTLAVAYSGGVDSSYLADVASEALGDRAHILLADSASIPRSEVEEASELARMRGWNFQIIHTNEMENESYLKNDGTRCYFCRSELFEVMRAYASEHAITHLSYGAIMDDLDDTTRVGTKAAAEYEVVAPLQDALLSKDEIRDLSRRRNLPTSEKASFACLSSRIPVGTTVNQTDLARVEATEEVLRKLGFHQYRCRHHGDLCRIEVGEEELGRFNDPATRDKIIRGARAAGYRHVTLDLCGYTTGFVAHGKQPG